MPSSYRSRSPMNELSDVSSDFDSDDDLSNLRKESNVLAATIEKLKNFKPQKKRVDRP